jgi:hypothetical protein
MQSASEEQPALQLERGLDPSGCRTQTLAMPVEL